MGSRKVYIITTIYVYYIIFSTFLQFNFICSLKGGKSNDKRSKRTC